MVMDPNAPEPAKVKHSCPMSDGCPLGPKRRGYKCEGLLVGLDANDKPTGLFACVFVKAAMTIALARPPQGKIVLPGPGSVPPQGGG